MYLSGEQKYAAIDVTSEATFAVSDEVFSFKSCADQTIILDEVAAEQEAIDDGIRVKYNLDTDGLADGAYLGIFEFMRVGIEKRKKTINIRISGLNC